MGTSHMLVLGDTARSPTVLCSHLRASNFDASKNSLGCFDHNYQRWSQLQEYVDEADLCPSHSHVHAVTEVSPWQSYVMIPACAEHATSPIISLENS
jgi:hypothetical protein